MLAGRPRNSWYCWRVRLSDWLHPDPDLIRRLPANPVAREAARLLFLNGDRLDDFDATAILVEIRKRLGIRPLLTNHLPYCGDD